MQLKSGEVESMNGEQRSEIRDTDTEIESYVSLHVSACVHAVSMHRCEFDPVFVNVLIKKGSLNSGKDYHVKNDTLRLCFCTAGV